jgi:TetR/AcrR family transcriptional regulator, regulator of biofilm formation and stress response
VARPPTQERSKQRREALLRAAIDLLAERGARLVTHRAVAERAGLPPASTTYYFESIQELIDEALRLHVSERVDEVRALAAAAAGDSSSVEELAKGLAKSLAERPRQMVTGQFEIYLEAARNPELRASVADALGAFEELCEALLSQLGAPDPAAAAVWFIAMLDGFALHQLANPRDTEEQAEIVFEAMRAMFISQVMSDAEVEKWHQSFREPLAAPAA